MDETNSLAEQTPEELAEAQYHTTLREFGIFIFPQVNATQMKECGACRRKCRPAEFDYKITPIRFGSFGEGAVVAFCDECYAPFKVALSALTTTAQERDEAQAQSLEFERKGMQLCQLAGLMLEAVGYVHSLQVRHKEKRGTCGCDVCAMTLPDLSADATKDLTDESNTAHVQLLIARASLTAVQQERDALRRTLSEVVTVIMSGRLIHLGEPAFEVQVSGEYVDELIAVSKGEKVGTYADKTQSDILA